MIQANELRIGNWVIDPLGEFMVVEQIGSSRNRNFIFARGKNGYGQNGFEPIPLAPEILERAGFEKNQENALEPYASSYNLEIPVKGENNNTICVLIENKGEKRILGNATVNDHWASNNFQYVHQLQNLYFALTGTELNINL